MATAQNSNLLLKTSRLSMSPITLDDASDLWEIVKDPRLHTYVNFKATRKEQAIERCQRWQKRSSPDESEIWLNWIARHSLSSAPVGHLQAGINIQNIASLGYILAFEFHGQGLAFEALHEVIHFLRTTFHVSEFRASIDLHNAASIRLVQKLGFAQNTLLPREEVPGAAPEDLVFTLKI